MNNLQANRFFNYSDHGNYVTFKLLLSLTFGRKIDIFLRGRISCKILNWHQQRSWSGVICLSPKIIKLLNRYTIEARSYVHVFILRATRYNAIYVELCSRDSPVSLVVYWSLSFVKIFLDFLDLPRFRSNLRSFFALKSGKAEMEKSKNRIFLG